MSNVDFPGNVPPHYSSAEIRAHPRFAMARTAYVDGLLGLYENDPFMNRLLLEASRSVIFFVILCLHAAYDETDRATWPTMRLLQQTMATFAISSARHVHNIVARLIVTGFLESRTAASDRRARILTPTDKMLAHDRDWLAVHYKPLDILFPDPGYGPPLRRDPVFQKIQRVAGISVFAYSAQTMMANTIAMFFMAREAGMMVVFKLVELARDQPRRISFADLGDRFGVSRTYVRTMLQHAERMGWLTLSDHGADLLPPLVEAVDRFVADGMSGHDLTFRIAMRHLGSSRGTQLSTKDAVTTDAVVR